MHPCLYARFVMFCFLLPINFLSSFTYTRASLRLSTFSAIWCSSIVFYCFSFNHWFLSILHFLLCGFLLTFFYEKDLASIIKIKNSAGLKTKLLLLLVNWLLQRWSRQSSYFLWRSQDYCFDLACLLL